jgi:DNA-binding CsgD family transcriptional regulator
MASFDESGFLDLLYGAAISPRLWESVLQRLCDMFDGSSGTLTRFDLTTGAGSAITARSDPTAVELYYRHFAAVNPLNNVRDPHRYRREWRTAILTDEDWMPKAELVRTEYYNDFCRRYDADSVMMVRLALHRGQPCVINISRSPRMGQFGAAELDLAARLHPHLIRAFDLGVKLAAERATDATAAGLIAQSPHGIFLLDLKGRVLRMSAAGEAMLADRASLTVRRGRLAAVDPGAARRLDALLGAAACPDHDRRAGGAMALPVLGRAVPLCVTVAPVRGEDETGLFDDGPRVLVCVTDPDARVQRPEERLRDLFGLTAAEARLALGLLAGDGLVGVAERFGVSHNTARVHLARIFEKTGVNRQSALAALTMRCVSPAAEAAGGPVTPG